MSTSPVLKKGKVSCRTIESMNYEILTESVVRIEATEEAAECLSICEMSLNTAVSGKTEEEISGYDDVSVI